MNGEPETPLACVPGAIPAAQRPEHFALTAHLFGSLAREKREIPNGYAFRFDPDDLEEIARFVANERTCCPFLAFTIEVSENEGPVWLRISGPEGSRALLDAELPI